MSYREKIYSSYRTSTYEDVNPLAIGRELIRSYDSEYDQWLPDNKHSRILDAGCGGGLLLQYLNYKGYENVSGVDTSSEQVEFCRSSGLDVVEANAIDYLADNKGYDVIFITDMVEHLSKNELIEVLEKVKEALNPGGHFIIRTINACSILGLHTRYLDLTHELSFNERSMVQIFRATGYSAIDIADTRVPFGLKPTRFLRWVLLGIWRSIYKSVLYLEAGVDRPRLLGKYILVRAQKPS